MTLDDLFEYLEGLRRDAYVKAVIRASESDDIIGFIGPDVPADLIHSFGLMALPVYGIDGGILSFSSEDNLCPVIDATVTYAKTDKCPLIHSCKLIVVDHACPLMLREIQKLKDKNIYTYSDNDGLIQKLNEVYGYRHIVSVNDHIKRIHELLHKLKYYSSLNGLQAYILEYYINFLTLDERINILQEIFGQVEIYDKPVKYIPVNVQYGAGIYRQIDRIYSGHNYRIIEDFCRGKGHYDFVYENCPYYEGKRISYE